MNKYSIIILSVIIIFLFSSCGENQPELISTDLNESWKEDVVSSDTASTEDARLIYVHISGAVNCPGLYGLKEGDRLYDGIMAAGGFNEEADQDYANLAEILTDGNKYEILTKDRVLAEKNGDNAESASHYTEDGLLDINLADRQELMTLPGIGGSKADSILAYREEKGSFKSIEEIKNISGIGNGIFADICACITVK